MDISNIAFRLIVILMPGIIATLIIKNLTFEKKWDSFKFSVNTLLFSGITYISLQLIINIWQTIISALRNMTHSTESLKVWGELFKDKSVIPFDEVFLASVLSIIVGLISTAIINKKLIFVLAQKMKISNKFGDENLYYEFMRSDTLHDIYLKDYENNITYHGYIEYYSESESIREIVLSDVDVYSCDESKFYYQTPIIFFSKKIDSSWTIETPKIISDEEE